MSIEDDIQLIRDLIAWSDSNPNRIAKRIGVANTTINRFAKGTAVSRLHRDTLAKLREHYPSFPAFASDADLPDAPPEQDHVSIAILPSFAGMGGGGTGEGDQETALLPRRLIEEDLRGNPGDFELIDVRGDSNYPEFLHGDQILIDKRDRNPVQPGFFALWDGDGYVVKRVQRVPGKRGFYHISSANPAYRITKLMRKKLSLGGGLYGSHGSCSYCDSLVAVSRARAIRRGVDHVLNRLDCRSVCTR